MEPSAQPPTQPPTQPLTQPTTVNDLLAALMKMVPSAMFGDSTPSSDAPPEIEKTPVQKYVHGSLSIDELGTITKEHVYEALKEEMRIPHFLKMPDGYTPSEDSFENFVREMDRDRLIAYLDQAGFTQTRALVDRVQEW